ncbi:MAG: hypothetical protein ACI9O0_000491 [Paracoccaceae bacterium]|jgi:hypothetical protein
MIANWWCAVSKVTMMGLGIFLHSGIVVRVFQRSFVLADGVDVAGAVMDMDFCTLISAAKCRKVSCKHKN